MTNSNWKVKSFPKNSCSLEKIRQGLSAHREVPVRTFNFQFLFLISGFYTFNFQYSPPTFGFHSPFPVSTPYRRCSLFTSGFHFPFLFCLWNRPIGLTYCCCLHAIQNSRIPFRVDPLPPSLFLYVGNLKISFFPPPGINHLSCSLLKLPSS